MRYDKEKVSHTSLLHFERHPSDYIKYREQGSFTTAAMEFGSIFHMSFLEREKYLSSYTIMNNDWKSIPPRYLAFIDNLIELRSYKGELTENELAVFAYNTTEELKNTKVDTVVEKFSSDSIMQEYYRYRLETLNKPIITNEQFNIIENCNNSAKDNKFIKKYLLEDGDADKAEKEIKLEWKDERGFNMVGVLDKLLLYENSAKIQDIKTTSKSIRSFETSYENYRYYRQLVIYKLATHVIYGIPLNNIDTHLLIFETKEPFRCVVRHPSVNDMFRGKKELETLLDELKWHFDNELWDHRRSYYEGDGSQVISL